MKALPKARLPMRNLVWALLFATVFSTHVMSSELKISGPVTQGGMIVAQSDHAIESANIDGVKIPVHPNGKVLVFGFGRDASPTAELTVTFKSGEQFRKTFEVKQREYDIDRVNGVAQKYVSPPKHVLERIQNDSKLVKAARGQLSHRLDFLSPFSWPAQGRISGVYGSQRVFNGVPKRPHFGMDIAGPTGTPVYAPISGKVVLAEPDLYYSGGTLIIDHGMGITSTYIHLSKIDVEEGSVVTQGDKIAEIGATGRVTGPHLDWRLNWFNRRLDPQLLLP
jgi:murein DD-endopeptidase MepM/ murein hydrolase activator NlpD